jgi:hypothetical protein
MTTQQPLDRFETELLAELRAVVTDAARSPAVTRPPRWRRPAISVLAVASAAAAIVLATSVVGPGSTPSASAADVLLGAARSAETASRPADGTYWHVHSIVAWDYGRLKGRLDTHQWQGKDGTLWASDNGQPVTEITGSGFYLCDKLVDYPTLQALPTEADALRAAVRDAMLHGDDGPVPAGDQDRFVTDCTIGLLTLPVSREVRGAAFRSLAALPGTENLGRTTDREGRVGSEVAFGDADYRQHVVIDPESGELLQYDFAGEKGKRQGTVVESGWTDTMAP